MPGAHVLFHHRQAAQFLHQAQVEHHLADPARDFVHGPRGFLAGDRIDRHQQQIAAIAFLNDRQDGRIGAVATVPIVLAIYGDGRKIHRQAGRSQQGIDAQIGIAENARRSRPGIGGRDEYLGGFRRPDCVEIDMFLQDIAENPLGHTAQARRRSDGNAAGADHRPQNVRRLKGRWKGFQKRQDCRLPGGVVDRFPERAEPGRGFFRPAADKAGYQDGRVQRPRTGTADRPNGNFRRFEEPVQHTPGEGSVRTPALKGQVKGVGFRGLLGHFV